jgi:sporulation protein YlmC with PRC-barrel domain
MKRKVIMCVLASAALAATAPVLAKPGGGGGGGNAGGHVGGGMGGGNGFGHSEMSVGTSRNSGHIGTTTIGRSNRLGSAAAHGTPLTGITNGMSVFDTGGAAVGTVTNISTKGNGSVRDVQVTLADGSRILLSPRSLTQNGGVLTTNSLTTTVKSQGGYHASVNGLAHASPHSALNGVGITTFTGLAPGMPVNNNAGIGVGSVSGLVLNRSGAIAGIRVALNGGGTALIPAPSLAFNGTAVTTSWMPRH